MKLLLLKLKSLDPYDVLGIIGLVCITIAFGLAFTLFCFLYAGKYQPL